jgi:hypothetical protein
MTVDYGTHLAALDFNTRSATHHETVSFSHTEHKYDPRKFGDGVHFVW